MENCSRADCGHVHDNKVTDRAAPPALLDGMSGMMSPLWNRLRPAALAGIGIAVVSLAAGGAFIAPLRRRYVVGDG